MTTAVVKQELAVASFSKVYDLDEVETALNDLGEGASEALRATYEKMLKVGNLRFCVKPNRMPSIDDLVGDLPNFAEPLDDIRKQIALCLETEDRLELMPILLLGDPGIGKTHFAKQLARLLGTSYHYRRDEFADGRLDSVGRVVAMAQRQAGQGVRCARERQLREPGDRPSTKSTRPPATRNTIRSARCTRCWNTTRRRRFIDEFAEMPINAGNVVWIATANDARTIPEPLLNRMNVYEIRAAGSRWRAPHRAVDLRRDPQRARVGRALPGNARRRAARRVDQGVAARNAARDAERIRQCAHRQTA